MSDPWGCRLPISSGICKGLSWIYFQKCNLRSSLVVQWVKDPTLSLQWLGSLLWQHVFSPWPRNFHMSQAWLKRKKSTYQIELWLWRYSPHTLVWWASVSSVFWSNLLSSFWKATLFWPLAGSKVEVLSLRPHPGGSQHSARMQASDAPSGSQKLLLEPCKTEEFLEFSFFDMTSNLEDSFSIHSPSWLSTISPAFLLCNGWDKVFLPSSLIYLNFCKCIHGLEVCSSLLIFVFHANFQLVHTHRQNNVLFCLLFPQSLSLNKCYTNLRHTHLWHAVLLPSSRRGSVVTNLTRIHKNEGLIPGLTQWVKDPALPWAVV